MTEKNDSADDMIRSTLVEKGDEKFKNVGITDLPPKNKHFFGSFFASSSESAELRSRLLPSAKTSCCGRRKSSN